MIRKSYIRTKIHRQKMSELKKGTIMSNDWIAKISLNHANVTGKNNPNYKGGISKTKRFCKECNKIFFVQLCKIKGGRGKFCSKICQGLWRGKNLRGKNAFNWQGGKTNIQGLIRKSKKYIQWRNAVYYKDNFICIFCKTGSGWHKDIQRKITLNADHIIPLGILIRQEKIKTLQDAMGCNKLWDINNGRTLCEDCHKTTKTYLNSSIIKDYERYQFN